MTKYSTEFDVGDIIKYKSSYDYGNLAYHYYLILKVGKRSYRILSFKDGMEYSLDKSDYYHYEKVS